MSQQPVDFTGLHAAFTKSLQLAFEKRSAQILRNSFDGFSANSDHDKKSPMDQAFREFLLFKLRDNEEDLGDIGALINLSVQSVRLEIVSVTIPVVLLGDIFETVTLKKCERIFNYVEEMVEVWKEEIFFSSCKNNILRMCNDLLRRLSRAQNTIFCGRILLFLSKFFPFSERSGLNIVSEFNLENVTEYGVDSKDLDDALEDTVEEIPIKIDYNLYCKFWSLQDFFRNPNQCYSKAQWKMFQTHADTILEAFSSFKLEEPRTSSTTNEDNSQESIDPKDYQQILDMDVDMIPGGNGSIENSQSETEQNLRKADHFFAKFLTNPKLLALQLSDSNFRRSLLVQFLILFQYLQLTVKFKTESNTLSTAQTDFIKETEAKVYRLLEETPPNGGRFARTVRHMLAREEMWNNWKNDGCKEFKKPDETETDDADSKPPPAKRAKPVLGDMLRDANRNGKFYLGNDVLTRLWNYCPDNLQACKSEERNFLPPLETYLENPYDKKDTSYEWRALRLLARQSPHFFFFTTSQSCKVADYLDTVRRRVIKEKMEMAKAASGSNATGLNNSMEVSENNAAAVTSADSNEQETMALQEQEGDGDDLGDDDGNEDKNTRIVPMTASQEQIEEIAPLIGDDWKKLGKKLGFEASELRDFEASSERDGGCTKMLITWFQDDEDATLDNWAYILEGLKMDAATKAVNALIQRLTANHKEVTTKEDDPEVISD